MLKVKVLAEMRFRVVAVCDASSCPAEDFINVGEASTKASRDGLMEMIQHVAERGLQNVPSAWWHEADKEKGVYEFLKGPLRLFFFKGTGNDIAICTSGIRKSGKKADKQSVNKAEAWKAAYFDAIANSTYEVLDDEIE